MGALVDTVDTAAMDMEASMEDTMASVRLRLSPTLAMVDTADTVDMVDTALATAGDSMASVRPRPSPTSDMEVMEDTVLVAMEDTVVTVMAMASKIILCRRNHSIMHKNVAFLMYLQIYIKMQK